MQSILESQRVREMESKGLDFFVVVVILFFHTRHTDTMKFKDSFHHQGEK